MFTAIAVMINSVCDNTGGPINISARFICNKSAARNELVDVTNGAVVVAR